MFNEGPFSERVLYIWQNYHLKCQKSTIDGKAWLPFSKIWDSVNTWIICSQIGVKWHLVQTNTFLYTIFLLLSLNTVTVVSISHFPAFYVVLVPLGYIPSIPLHSSYVIDIRFILFKKWEGPQHISSAFLTTQGRLNHRYLRL